MAKRGRKKIDNPRLERIVVLVNDEEYDCIYDKYIAYKKVSKTTIEFTPYCRKLLLED